MRKLLTLLAVAIVAVAITALVRTLLFTAPTETFAQTEAPVASADSLAAHLAQAIQFRTISVSDTSPPAAEELAAMRAWMENTYPLVHQALTREVVAEHSLLYTWKGTDTALAPIVLMGHMDVVPVEAGTESKWTHPPFSGDVADGYVWGRGSLDDKPNVIGILEAVERLLATNVVPRRTVLLAFGHNEEVLGSGAKAIVALLQSRGVRPALVIDEGGAITEGIMQGIARPVAIIGIAEKGYQSFELINQAAGGHSSVPPRETATGIVAAGVAAIEANPLPARLTPVVRAMLDRTGREMSGGAKTALANLWLFEPVLLSQFAKTPQTNAMIRTTGAPTMFSGSPKDNVLPQRARAVVNFRILPGDSIAGVLAYVKRTVNDERIIVRPAGPGSEPSPVSPVNSPEYRLLERTIHETAPGTMVVPYLLVGGTDSRHYAPITRNIYRFTAMRAKQGDLERVHGTNERLAVAKFREIVQFYLRLIQNGAVQGYETR
jgi:carboxypeptidase PM20D1